VRSNCRGGLVVNVTSPETEEYALFSLVFSHFDLSSVLFLPIILLFANFSRFKLPLPKDILSEGKHTVLVDATGQYFGIVAQKRSSFLDQSMLMSARTQQIAKADAALERKKIQMSEKFEDDELEAEYCRRKLKAIEEKNTLMKKKEIDAKKKFNKMILVDQVYDCVDENIENSLDEENVQEDIYDEDDLSGPTIYVENSINSEEDSS
jgi:hypothetical protein